MARSTMTPRSLLLAALCAGATLSAAVTGLGAAAPGQDQPSPLPTVLARAATYVEAFAAKVSGVVMAESYVQDVKIGRAHV